MYLHGLNELEDDEIHGGESCDFCNSIGITFQIVTGLVRQLQGVLPATKLNSKIYNLQRAEHNIHVFKSFVMRSSLSRKQWNTLKAQNKENSAFLVVIGWQKLIQNTNSKPKIFKGNRSKIIKKCCHILFKRILHPKLHHF